MRRSKLAAACALMLSLSACKVTVTYSTRIEQDRSGAFGFQIALDEEAAAQFGDQRIPSLFQTLGEDGWEIATERPEGGLVISAERPFEDLDELGEVFDELRSAREGGGAGEFGGVNLALSANQNEDPVSTQTQISGSLDFGPLQDLDAATKAEFARAIAFRIVADMPGDPIVSEGAANIDEEGRVVWLPRFGEPMTFEATATVREPTLFIGLLLGGGALLLIVLAAVIGGGRRRRRRDALEAFEVEESRGFEVDPFEDPEPQPVPFKHPLDAVDAATDAAGQVEDPWRASPTLRRDPFAPSEPMEERIYSDDPSPSPAPGRDEEPDPFR